MKSMKRTIAVLVAVSLMIGCVIGGSLAWLTAQSETVKNTFTSAELFVNPSADFTLSEHTVTDVNQDGQYELGSDISDDGNSYDILPGVDIPKDPFVHVDGLQENAYLYVKVAEKDFPTDRNGLNLSYGITNDWLPLGGYDNVYVYCGSYADSNKVIKATDISPTSFDVYILTGNKVVVPQTYNSTADGFKLEFEAYMVQATGNGSDAVGAWANTYGKVTT